MSIIFSVAIYLCMFYIFRETVAAREREGTRSKTHLAAKEDGERGRSGHLPLPMFDVVAVCRTDCERHNKDVSLILPKWPEKEQHEHERK